MSKYRRAAKVDANQPDIVEALRKIPGVSVQLDVDDILVGYKGQTYWYEIKVDPKSEVKPAQYKIAKEYTGHYKFAFSLSDILEDIGIEQKTAARSVFNAAWMAIICEDMTPALANKWAAEAVEQYKSGNSNIDVLIKDIVKGAKCQKS